MRPIRVLVVDDSLMFRKLLVQIGRASCRERVCLYV